MLYKVVLTFDPVKEFLNRDYRNESYWPVLSSCAVYYVAQGVSNLTVCLWKNSLSVTIQMNIY